ncbi:lipid-A-disaccharide synthase [Verrucomicrobia bacterium LW23]|nr:lipid-A-disaccharide synthase [Verrucomicrobia bacterium LW23]
MENRTQAPQRTGGATPPAMPVATPPRMPAAASAPPALPPQQSQPPLVQQATPIAATVEVEPYATIMLVAGEASGDAHAAALIHALRRYEPTLRFIGAGGPQMAAAGQDQLFDLAAYAVVGLWEVLPHYFTFRRFQSQLLALARKEKPAVVILVDYPGFNLRMLPGLRAALPHSRLVYYIAPQTWAWKPGRAQQMAQHLNLLLTLFPFEVEWFNRNARRLPVQCVGHPTLDRLDFSTLGPRVPGRVALLPGSRAAEVKSFLPIMWEAAHMLAAKRVGIHFVLITPNEEMRRTCMEILDKLDAPSFPFEVFSSYQLTHLARCEMAMVKSGTSSLECAFVGVVPVIVYRLHPVTAVFARWWIKLKHVGMINLLAGEEIVPELLQEQFTSRNLAQTTWRIIRKPRIMQETRQAMAEVIAGTLGGPGASERAAEAVLREVETALHG